MRRTLLLCAIGTLGAAAAAPAQLGSRTYLQFQLGGDTAVGAFGGKDFTITVTGTDVAGYGVDSFAVRIPFDSTRLSFVGATKLCPDTTAPLHAVAGGSVVTVSTAKCSASPTGEQPLFQLTFHLAGTAVDGTWLSLVPLALFDNFPNNRLGDAAVNVAQVCHATGLWGDVSGDGIVNSLDALVTLSGAVGLPTGSYSLTDADVDADGQVTSRDALIMLSAGIGLPTAGFRVNKGVVDRCAAQVLLPRPLYFNRYGASPGVTGVSGLAVRTAGDSAVTVPADSADATAAYGWRPRVSPDGTHIVFVCLNVNGYPNICKANADGSGAVRLTAGFNFDQSPDWSPDGTRIVFIENNAIWTMNADGSAAAQAPGPAWLNVTSVAWNPVLGSDRVAYTNTNGAGEVHIASVDSSGNDLTVLSTVCCTTYQPRFIDWTAAGDSVLFDLYVDANFAVAAAPAAVGAGLDLRIMMIGAAQQPAWTDQGILFVAPNSGPNRVFLQRPDRSIVQIRPDNVDNLMPGMKRVP